MLQLFLFAALSLFTPQAPQTPTFAEGIEHMRAQDWPDAVRVFEARVAANDQEARSWFQLGMAWHMQGKWEEALQAHSRAAGFPATRVLGAYNAACACSQLQRADEAFAWIQKAVAAGWGDRKQWATDSDLDPIRSDPRFAKVLPPLLEGSDLFAEKPEVLYTLVGEGPGDQFGWVARVVGDLDGDGVLDFATTAPSRAGWSGSVYVYSGKTGALRFRVDGEPGWSLGNSVEGRVDFNGDGVLDVIAGAPGMGQQSGRVLLVSGKDGSRLRILEAGVAGDRFGLRVAGIPDQDGDGHADVLVGAPGDGAGKVYLLSSASGKQLAMIDGEAKGDQFGCALDATFEGGVARLVVGASGAGPTQHGRAYLFRYEPPNWVRYGMIDSDKLGANLGQYFTAFLGDVDGDGISDAYASDWNHGCRGPGTGRAYICSGASGAQIRTIDGRHPGEGFGTSQAVCGDANGDGVADLCIGAWQNPEGGPSAGKVYLVSGKDGTDLATWTSLQAGDTLGFDAVGLGDANGDGQDDFLVTAAWSTVQFGRQGRVFVLAGPALRPKPGQESEAK